jgi:hypothetical protein
MLMGNTDSFSQAYPEVFLDQSNNQISQTEFANLIYLDQGVEGYKKTENSVIYKVLPFAEIGELDSVQLSEVYNVMSNYVTIDKDQISFIELYSWDGDFEMSDFEKKEIKTYLESLQGILKEIDNINYFNVYTKTTGIYVYDDLISVFRDQNKTFEKYFFPYQHNYPCYLILEPNGTFTLVRKYVDLKAIEQQLTLAKERLEFNDELNNTFLNQDLREIDKEEFISRINPDDDLALKILHGENRYYRIISKRQAGQLNKEEFTAILKNLNAIKAPDPSLPIIIHFQPNKYTGQTIESIYPDSNIKKYNRIIKKIGGVTEYFIGARGHMYSYGEILDVHMDKNRRISNILFPDYQSEMNYAVIYPSGKYRRYYGKYSHDQVLVDFLEMRFIQNKEQ